MIITSLAIKNSLNPSDEGNWDVEGDKTLLFTYSLMMLEKSPFLVFHGGKNEKADTSTTHTNNDGTVAGDSTTTTKTIQWTSFRYMIATGGFCCKNQTGYVSKNIPSKSMAASQTQAQVLVRCFPCAGSRTFVYSGGVSVHSQVDRRDRKSGKRHIMMSVSGVDTTAAFWRNHIEPSLVFAFFVLSFSFTLF